MRCPECGATNTDSADWCSQCYTALGTAPAPPQPPSSSSSERDPDPSSDPDPSPERDPDPHDEPRQPTAEGFRRRDGAVEWECPSCGQWSPVESLRCGVCATTIAARWERSDLELDHGAIGRRLAEPWTAAFALSAVVPGAGHIGLGLHGTGFARAVLFAVWLAGGVALWRAGGIVAGGPLLLGGVVLWVASLADIAALRGGGRQLLAGRSLLWLVVGVLVLSLVGMFLAAGGRPAPTG